MAVKKADLIKILVEEYGYEKEDLKMLTNGKLQAMIKQEEKDAEALENEATLVVAQDNGIKDDDQIVVMNGLDGALTHRSTRTGRAWKFKAFGQTDKIPYGELQAIRNMNDRCFTEGWLIVLNKQVQEEFGLTEIYKNIITPQNIDEIFNKDVDELEAFIDALPEGHKITFVAKARELFKSGKLDSRRVVDLIENKFKFSLEDNAPLSDIV
ncbi:hypothetical protein [Priestia megaterium]|uniref:hypothetical protein n=1 Tax=Priestia megaterium TaxID=1404 RepID=UPI000BFD070C|nr:hypothetical protein [Priestia megaterium]PGO60713.1 hypothetical protein CN981_09250 [Priestia megaterium]